MKFTTLEYQDHKIECHHQGAHLSSWCYRGKEQLFLSERAIFKAGTAIRGGVPICFPQFGAFGAGDKHGFARNSVWTLLSSNDNALSFELKRDKHDIGSPFKFRACFTASLSGNTLSLALNVDNLDSTDVEFTCALHSYFRVDDILNVVLTGLKGKKYWDNGSDFQTRSTEVRPLITFTSAIDRVYFDVSQALTLEDRNGVRVISGDGFRDVVVWNPWSQGTAQLKDMKDDEYLKMICIESANIETPVKLAPSESWSGTQNITIKGINSV